MYVPNTPPQPEYWVLSLSGGKDSTALGLEWLKRHQQDPVTYPLDEVVYSSTSKKPLTKQKVTTGVPITLIWALGKLLLVQKK